MIYDRGTPGNGVWHCPFPPEWVEKMKRAAKHCQNLTAEYIDRTIEKEWMYISLPPGDFLSSPQDIRGLPVWYGRYDRIRVSCDIYDYNSVPDIVATNGEEDWPYNTHGKILQA